MTITRTLVSTQFDSTIRLSEQTVNSLDPTLPNGQYGNVQSGGQLAFNGTSGPAATQAWHGLVTLIAGALTLDLTALADATLGTISMSGLKLKFMQIIATAGNANPITIAPGAVNGYTGWVGSAGLSLNASDQEMLVRNAGIAVDGTHKTLDLAGTGTQSAVIVLLFG